MNEIIHNCLKGYRCTYSIDEDGDGMPLVDMLSPRKDATISLGNMELEMLADFLDDELGDLLNSQSKEIDLMSGRLAATEQLLTIRDDTISRLLGQLETVAERKITQIERDADAWLNATSPEGESEDV